MRMRVTLLNPTDKPPWCESKAPSNNRRTASLISDAKLLSRASVKNKDEFARRAYKEGTLVYASTRFTLAN